jgi:hypothetical protein
MIETRPPMSPEEFMNTVRPQIPTRMAAKLDQHRDAIDKLRAAGYSLRQVCDYLERCGLTISFQQLSKYLRGPQQKPAKATPVEQARPAQTVPETQAASSPTPAVVAGGKTRDEIATENPGLTKKQVDEKYLDQFAKPPENPLLRRRKSS